MFSFVPHLFEQCHIPVQVCTFLQKKNNDMNRQKAEEKGIGREGSRHGQVKEIGRARK